MPTKLAVLFTVIATDSGIERADSGVADEWIARIKNTISINSQISILS